MQPQLILVEGVPGSGKSVAAQTPARALRATGATVRWWCEEELDHAIFVFRDAASLQQIGDQLFSGAHEEVLSAAVEKCASSQRPLETNP